MRFRSFLCLGILLLGFSSALATSNYRYGADEYVTVARGISPDGRYAVTAHGGGDYGYDGFHLYLTDAATGRSLGTLEKIQAMLDTGAGAYAAKWSDDSRQVEIVYRISRHLPLQAARYRIEGGRALLKDGPSDATETLGRYWRDQCGASLRPSDRIFGGGGGRPSG